MITKSKLNDYTDKLFYQASNFGIKTAYKLTIKPLLRHYIINHAKGDRLDLEYNALKAYLIEIISPIIQKYSISTEHFDTIKTNDIIWVCWWQGEKEMPIIVKKCYKLLHKHSNGRPIILISQDNFERYITLPSHIIELFKAKLIPIQQFSDIIRMYLISHHGGIWIDATYWITKDINIPNDFPFFSIKTGNIYDPFISRGKWSINLLGGTRNSKLFCFIYDSLIEYWRNRKYVIDYFLTDCLIQIAYENFSDIKYIIDTYTLVYPNIFNFDINQRYNKNIVDKLIQNNAFIKLSWKKEYLTHDTNNNLSIYGYFLNL